MYYKIKDRAKKCYRGGVERALRACLVFLDMNGFYIISFKGYLISGGSALKGAVRLLSVLKKTGIKNIAPLTAHSAQFFSLQLFSRAVTVFGEFVIRILIDSACCPQDTFRRLAFLFYFL